MRFVLPSLCLLLIVLAPISSAQLIVETPDYPAHSEDLIYVPAGEITRIPTQQLLDNDPFPPTFLHLVEFVLTRPVPEVELSLDGELVIDPGPARQARFRFEYGLRLGVREFGYSRVEVVVVPRWQPVSLTFQPPAAGCGEESCLTWFSQEQQLFKVCNLSLFTVGSCLELPVDVTGEGPYIPISLSSLPLEAPALYATQTGLLHKLKVVHGRLEEQLTEDLGLPLHHYPVYGDWNWDGVPTFAGYDSFNQRAHLEADALPILLQTGSTQFVPLVSTWTGVLGPSLGLWDTETGELHYLVDGTGNGEGVLTGLEAFAGSIPFAGYLEDGRPFIGFYQPDEGFMEAFGIEVDGRPTTHVRVPVDPNGGGER